MLQEASHYLMEDPTIYEYDSLHDSMTQIRKEVEASKRKDVTKFEF